MWRKHRAAGAGARHEMMVKGDLCLALPHPRRWREIDEALLRRILRQAGVTRDEFERARRA